MTEPATRQEAETREPDASVARGADGNSLVRVGFRVWQWSLILIATAVAFSIALLVILAIWRPE